MKKYVILSALAAMPMLAIASIPASALTVTSPGIAHETLIEKARSDCRWVDNKWTYQRGDKRLVCRPDRPRGKGWGWHREGNRFGWYQSRGKRWHHNAW
ncbi:MAG: hypothetical protein ABL901_14040 [Hyphomicrobiaceae bacterium]